jgi:hypothetical protein
MQNELDDFDQKPERPQFLKILCILTFIGSGYLVCSSLFNYINPNVAARIMVQVKVKDSSNLRKDSLRKAKQPAFFREMLKNAQTIATPENIRKTSECKILTGCLCLFGAIWMWRLKRNGYYIYILGVVLEIATPFYLFGNNSLSIISTIGTAFFGVLFIIFYGMNIKSMR